ncbi:MAG: FAD-dependent oxidoreductase [Isosphaeraceae bacterium]
MTLDRASQSGPGWSRRAFLGTLAATPGMAILGAGPGSLRRVAIVGGGMAGVALAWLLDGHREVHLLEARDVLGGNVRGVQVEVDGVPVVVDLGAQYFHPGPYPTYVRLLTRFGLFDPVQNVATASHDFPASITVAGRGEPLPRFLSPLPPDRFWQVFEPWNFDGLWAFGLVFWAAGLLEAFAADYDLTMDAWLRSLGLSQRQREEIILPWVASLYSGSVEQARGLSARAAMVFVSLAQPADPVDPVSYFVLDPGMGEVLRVMSSQCSTVSFRTGARVQRLARGTQGVFVVRTDDGQSLEVDELVFATPAPVTRQLLEDLPGTDAQREKLRGIEYHDARLALHRDPAYAPADSRYWSFLNCEPDGAFCEASMWLAPVLRGVPPATSSRLWKSWITHRRQAPQEVLSEAAFRHMLPTPATIRAQRGLLSRQGRGGVWFAGGYTRPYDSQETALRSAMDVALAMRVYSNRLFSLL